MRAWLAAQAYLIGLVESTASHRTFSMNVRIRSPWVTAWPHMESGGPSFELPVADGKVDLMPWKEDVGVCKLSAQWFSLTGFASADRCLDLPTFMCQCVGLGNDMSLLSQVVSQVAFQAEIVLYSILKAGPKPGDVEVTPHSIMDVLQHDGRLDYDLLQHSFAGVKASTGANILSLATDKANVGGLQLARPLFVLPTNPRLSPGAHRYLAHRLGP